MPRKRPRPHMVFPTHPKFNLSEWARGHGDPSMDLRGYVSIKNAKSVDELPHMRVNGEDFVMIEESKSKARLSDVYRKQVKPNRPRAKCLVLKTRDGKRGLYVRNSDLAD